VSAFQAECREFDPRPPLNKKIPCLCSSGVEHFLGKEEVVSSILIKGSAKESTDLQYITTQYIFNLN
jgi:hypothetical protein